MVRIYWWNYYKRTLDFAGPIKEFLQHKNIKVRRISNNGVSGYRFKIPLSCITVILDIFDNDYERSAVEAIRVFLTLLGDKAKLETTRRNYKINWDQSGE